MELEKIYNTLKNRLSVRVIHILYFVPFGMIFFSNILITQLKGFAYMGELAIFIASSSFLAIIFGLRWDTELLIRPLASAELSFVMGSSSIFILTAGLSFIAIPAFLFLDQEITALIALIISAAFLSFNELFCSILLKKEQKYLYLFCKSLPYIFLLFCVAIDLGHQAAWVLALLCSIIINISCTYSFLAKLKISEVLKNQSVLKNLYHKISPMLSAVITNSYPLLLLFFIQLSFGGLMVGVWINAYRIFSLPAAITGAVFLPFFLNTLSSQKNNIQILSMYKYLLIVFLLTLPFLLFTNIYGNDLFQTLTQSDFSVDPLIFIFALVIGYLQYSLQFLKDLFQTLRYDYIFLLILLMQLFISLVAYFLFAPITIISLLSIILTITSLTYLTTMFLLTFLSFQLKKN